MNNVLSGVLFGALCGLVFLVGYGGILWLLKWSLGKHLVITWKPFSIKIEKR